MSDNLFYTSNKQRLTQAQKDANDQQWYKQQADLLDSYSFSENNFVGFGGVSEYKRKKVNYDLFNNIINTGDFEYVCKPFGANAGELPANLTNRDITSGKIKVLLGMEMKMPFSWKVAAVNAEATTRKEQEEFGQIRDFVVNEIMKPIKIQAEQDAAAQSKGKDLTPEEKQQIQDQIDQTVDGKTPDEVRRYMMREHQDPAEMLAHQLLEYLIQKERIADKFNKGFKHSLLSGQEVYWVGILNGEPVLKVVNNLYFDHDKSPDLDYIEDGEWAVCEYRMTPSEVIANLGSELTEDEIDKVYQFHQNNPSHIHDADFTFNSTDTDSPYTVRVLHCAWKSLRKIQYLHYNSPVTGKVEMKVVDENYRLCKDCGDINLESDWIPETHETWKIMHDIYVYCRPIPGQLKDVDNLYGAKLPYYGAAHDNLNSPVTAPMDRMKAYQYYYNIILYRIELLMASDKGKILAANINAVPKSAGIDTAHFMYFMEANKIAWFNPSEEGNKGGTKDLTNLVKEIDMSLASDIQKYINFAEYIEKKCGDSIGVTKQMEGSIGPNESVTNTKQNIIQSSHIIQPYFELHNNVKGNVLQALIDTAKVAYSTGQPKKLNYILDDMSLKMLTIDQNLLDDSSYGIFIANSSKAADAKQAVESLAHAAMQTQQADLLDIIKVIRSESIIESEELLQDASDRKAKQMQAADQQKQAAEAELEQKQQSFKREEWQHEADMITLKAKEDRETKVQVQAMLSTGFDPNKDEDEDGTPDVLEIAKFGVDADIKRQKLALDRDKLNQKTTHDSEKLRLEEKKITKLAQKKTNS